jgi:hypothetical protein
VSDGAMVCQSARAGVRGHTHSVRDFGQNYEVFYSSELQVQISFKEIKVLCEKNSIPFKIQTFTQLVTQMRVKYFDELKGRINFSKEFKQLVLNKSKGICACFNCKIDKKFHTDHIIPL